MTTITFERTTNRTDSDKSSSAMTRVFGSGGDTCSFKRVEIDSRRRVSYSKISGADRSEIHAFWSWRIKEGDEVAVLYEDRSSKSMSIAVMIDRWWWQQQVTKSTRLEDQITINGWSVTIRIFVKDGGISLKSDRAAVHGADTNIKTFKYLSETRSDQEFVFIHRL